jgi:uncharacterized protein YacL
MPVTATFTISHPHISRNSVLPVNIQVTGSSLQELKNQAEKFAQDYAILKGYPPGVMQISFLDDSTIITDFSFSISQLIKDKADETKGKRK